MHTPGAETTPPISRRSAPRRISIRAPAPGATVPRYSGRISGRCFDPHSHAESDPFRYRCRKGQAGRYGLRETAPRGHRSALENEPQALRCRSHDQGRIEIRGDSARPLTKLNADADSDAGSARIAGPSMTPARTNLDSSAHPLAPLRFARARARPRTSTPMSTASFWSPEEGSTDRRVAGIPARRLQTNLAIVGAPQSTSPPIAKPA